MKNLTLKSGLNYSQTWEIRNNTLTVLENQVKDNLSLLKELYEGLSEMPSACTSEADTAKHHISLLESSIKDLRSFIKLQRDSLNESIKSAVQWYGQKAPEWFKEI